MTPTRILAIACLTTALSSTLGAAAEVKLWRLDCGDIQVNDLNLFSDTMAYPDTRMALVGSCYLVKHDADYLLWDTGLPAKLLGALQDPSAALRPRRHLQPAGKPPALAAQAKAGL